MSKMKDTFIPILKGLLAGIIAIVILYGIFSILMSALDSPNKYTYPATLIGLIISLPIAGFTAVKVSDNKKPAIGGFCGLVYIILLFIVSSVMNKDFSIGLNTLILLIIGVAAGTIGGLLYINRMNSKKSKRNRSFTGKPKKAA